MRRILPMVIFMVGMALLMVQGFVLTLAGHSDLASWITLIGMVSITVIVVVWTVARDPMNWWPGLSLMERLGCLLTFHRPRPTPSLDQHSSNGQP